MGQTRSSARSGYGWMDRVCMDGWSFQPVSFQLPSICLVSSWAGSAANSVTTVLSFQLDQGQERRRPARQLKWVQNTLRLFSDWLRIKSSPNNSILGVLDQQTSTHRPASTDLELNSLHVPSSQVAKSQCPSTDATPSRRVRSYRLLRCRL